MAIVTQAYRFGLDPTPSQQRMLASHVGATRMALNRMLAEVEATLSAREWERRILGGPLTEPQGVVIAGVAANLERQHTRVGAAVVGVVEGGVQAPRRRG